MASGQVTILDRPSPSWIPTWDNPHVLQRTKGLSESVVNFIVSIISDEAVNRYVYAYPTTTLGNLSAFHAPDKQREVSELILSSLNQRDYSANLTMQFQWLVRAYEYQRLLIKKFLLAFVPTANRNITKIPQTSNEFENELQACAGLVLSKDHDFIF